MMRVTWTSLRVRLLLVTALAVLPMFGLAPFMAAEQRRLATVDVQEDSLHLVRVIAHRHEQLIDGTRQLLASLVHAPEVSGHEPATCSALLATLLQGYPAYLNLGVIQPDGTLVCSALPFRAPVNVSDRAYFRRALETRDFAIGDFQIGRVTGKPSVGFGHPVRSATGAVQAVLFASLDLAWLNHLATAVRLPTDVTLTVVDHQGTVLARYPDPQSWLGQAAHEAPLVQRLLAHGDEGTTTATGLDRLPRLSACVWCPDRGVKTRDGYSQPRSASGRAPPPAVSAD
jgi:hypothetical protein